MTRHFVSLALVSSLFALTACGGGGGDSSTGTGSGGTGGASGGSSGGASVTVVTPAAGTPQAGVMAQLNGWRNACGFGSVANAQNLNLSAVSHAGYIVDQLFLGQSAGLSVTEPTAGKASVTERAAREGYVATVAQETFFALNVGTGTTPVAANETFGQVVLRALAANPAQMPTLFRGWEHIGFGVGAKAASTAGTFNNAYVLDAGRTQAVADIAAGTVASFPCQGVTGVVAGVTSHVAYDGTLVGAASGAPIYLRVRESDRLALVSATLSTGGVAVPLVADTMAQPGANELVLVPISALAENAVYDANVTLTINGTQVSKAFQFTTGKTLTNQLLDDLFVK